MTRAITLLHNLEARAAAGASVTMLEWALAISPIAPVFPLVAGTKVPPKGFTAFYERASSAESVIRPWWSADPDANIGVSTRGLFVLDIDRKGKRNGIASLQDLAIHEGLDLPPTFRVRTPSGGEHRYYRLPLGAGPVPCSVDRIARGVDVRGWHGYVVGPGSIVDGRRYQVITNG